MAVASSFLGVMAVFLCPMLSSAVSLQRQTATSASASIGPDHNLQDVMRKIKNYTSSDEIKEVLQRAGHDWVPGPVPPKSPEETNMYNTILSWSYGHKVDFYPVKKKIYETVPKELADAVLPLIWAVTFVKGDMNSTLTKVLDMPAVWAQPIKDATAAAKFTEVLSALPPPGPVPPKDEDETNFYNQILSWSYGYPLDFYPVKKKIYETLPKELADAALPLIWVVVLTKGDLVKTLTKDLDMPAEWSVPILEAAAAANFHPALPTTPLPPWETTPPPPPGPVPPKDEGETNFYNTLLSWSYGKEVDFYPVKKKIYETLPKEMADKAVSLVWVVVLTKGDLIKTLTEDLDMPQKWWEPILDAVAAAHFTEALPTSSPAPLENLAPSASPFFSIIAALVIAAIGGSSASGMF